MSSLDAYHPEYLCRVVSRHVAEDKDYMEEYIPQVQTPFSEGEANGSDGTSIWYLQSGCCTVIVAHMGSCWSSLRKSFRNHDSLALIP
jgi:hypothetical protein